VWRLARQKQLPLGKICRQKGRGILAFFLLFFCQYAETQGQDRAIGNFPVIARIDSRDITFKQYISDVEYNRRLLAQMGRQEVDAASNLTIFQYTTQRNDTLFSVAARCNIPYSALASINRLDSPNALEEGRLLLLPSFPGIFIPENAVSDFEILIRAARSDNERAVELRINRDGNSEIYHFIAGADFTPTERTFFLNSNLFRLPLRNYRFTSAYGVRVNPVSGNVSMHQGIDLAAPEGTEVYAAADGVVTEIGENPIYGIYVIITHQNRMTSLYGHLQKTETVLRAAVRSGTLIGRVGSTGQSTGPHLHFELRQDGRALDPSGRLRL
jgi:murein DD-endopeptidase MepM/ murein hydrolase activator NlpD